MKKVFPILWLLLALGAVSCNKDHPSGRIKKPKAVDIGLVVNGKNIKWANLDLGASEEGMPGNYYAWGELAPKENYSIGTYSFANEEGKFTKYCWNNDSGKNYWGGTEETPDDLSVLLPDDDVAHKILGGKWRMPTKEELGALVKTRSNPEYSWIPGLIKREDGSWGHYLVIKQVSTGNYIRLPFSGYWDGEGIPSTGSGYFWASTLSPNAEKAACMKVSSITSASEEENYRHLGFCIRAVCE